jgi:hypothetical protein
MPDPKNYQTIIQIKISWIPEEKSEGAIKRPAAILNVKLNCMQIRVVWIFLFENTGTRSTNAERLNFRVAELVNEIKLQF